MQDSKSIPEILASLTRQEVKVLKLTIKGLTNDEIAKKFNLSIITIKSHQQHIAHKAQAKGTVEIRKFRREAASHLKIVLF